MDETNELLKSLEATLQSIIHRDFRDVLNAIGAIRQELAEIKTEQIEHKEVLKSMIYDMRIAQAKR